MSDAPTLTGVIERLERYAAIPTAPIGLWVILDALRSLAAADPQHSDEFDTCSHPKCVARRRIIEAARAHREAEAEFRRSGRTGDAFNRMMLREAELFVALSDLDQPAVTATADPLNDLPGYSEKGQARR